MYALNKGFLKVDVEEDSKILIDCIDGKSCTLWKLKSNVKDIFILSSFLEISFKHIFRETNFIANTLAKTDHNLWDNMAWKKWSFCF